MQVETLWSKGADTNAEVGYFGNANGVTGSRKISFFAQPTSSHDILPTVASLSWFVYLKKLDLGSGLGPVAFAKPGLSEAVG